MQQINIVISGFTPYEGIDVNPAVLVPAAVAKQWADPAQSQAISEELLQDIAVTVTNVTLPVRWAICLFLIGAVFVVGQYGKGFDPSGFIYVEF